MLSMEKCSIASPLAQHMRMAPNRQALTGTSGGLSCNEDWQLQEAMLTEQGNDGSPLLYDQNYTSEEDELWSDEGHWST